MLSAILPFNLAIDSKLRGCDLVSLRVRDVTHVNQVLPRAQVVQRKTQRPVQFELTEPTRSAVRAWLEKAALRPKQYLFPSRLSASPRLSTRQYARMIRRWAGAAGLDPPVYGTHSMGRTKATLIYKRTKNLRAVQLLLGHSKTESTIRYLGIEVDNALEISEQTELWCGRCWPHEPMLRVGSCDRFPSQLSSGEAGKLLPLAHPAKPSPE
jgi:integrase